MSTEPQSKTGRIGVSENVALELIKDQAASLVHGWREAIQNAVDAPGSSRIDVEITEEKTVVEDDGEGMEVTQGKMEEVLTTLGESTKDRDDDQTIGQFGIGLGQILAKARTVVQSHGKEVVFDVKEWGLEYKLRDSDRTVDGFRVEMTHYRDEVPGEGDRKWREYVEELRQTFRYIGYAMDVEIYLSESITDTEDEVLGDTDPVDEVGGLFQHGFEGKTETDNYLAAITVGDEGDISIYSNGLYVKNIDGEGFSGVVVTKENLDLNFARNDIKSGCNLWREIKQGLDELKTGLAEEVSGGKANSDLRRYIADKMSEDKENYHRFSSKQIFKTVRGQKLSAVDIEMNGEYGYSRKSNESDKVEGRGYVVLDRYDSANKIYKRYIADRPYVSDVEKFIVEERANKLDVNEGYEKRKDFEVEGRDRSRLEVARYMAQRLGIDRAVIWGEDEDAEAWTNGRDYIVITKSVFSSGKREVWIHKLLCTLVHEWMHDDDTKGGADHSNRFNWKFREKLESKETTEALESTVEWVEKNGLSGVVELSREEKKQVDRVKDTLDELESGDKVVKNNDKHPCTVKKLSGRGAVLEGIKGGEYRVVDSREEWPVVENKNTGGSKPLKKLEIQEGKEGRSKNQEGIENY